MNTKALFLDLDGTLLNDQKQLTAGNRAAMERALAAGHRLIITTGRPLVSAIYQAQQLGLDVPGCYVIAYNGGIIYDLEHGEIIHQQRIPNELVNAVFAEAARRSIHIQTYSDTQVVVEPRCDDREIQHYTQVILMTHQVIPDIRQLPLQPVKMLCIDLDNPAPLAAFRDWVLLHHGDRLDSFFSCDTYLEIIPRGLNKGSAILQLANLLGIPYENTIAVGDAANDLSMIRSAHLGIAMCNGTDEVKAAANAITGRDNNHDGIAWVIEQYLQVQKSPIQIKNRPFQGENLQITC